MLLDEAMDIINAIKTNNHYELNDWEEGFIQSLENQLSLDTKLSGRQEKKLKELWDKCYGTSR